MNKLLWIITVVCLFMAGCAGEDLVEGSVPAKQGDNFVPIDQPNVIIIFKGPIDAESLSLDLDHIWVEESDDDGSNGITWPGNVVFKATNPAFPDLAQTNAPNDTLILWFRDDYLPLSLDKRYVINLDHYQLECTAQGQGPSESCPLRGRKFHSLTLVPVVPNPDTYDDPYLETEDPVYIKRSSPPDAIDFDPDLYPPFPPHGEIRIWFSEPMPYFQLASTAENNPILGGEFLEAVPDDLTAYVDDGTTTPFDSSVDTRMRARTVVGWPIDYPFSLIIVSTPSSVGGYVACIEAQAEPPTEGCSPPELCNRLLAPSVDGSGAPIIMAAADQLIETFAGSGIYWGTYLAPSGPPGSTGTEQDNIDIEATTARVRIDFPDPYGYFDLTETGGVQISGICTRNSGNKDVTSIAIYQDGGFLSSVSCLEGDPLEDFGYFVYSIPSGLSDGVTYELKAVATSADGKAGFDVINATAVQDDTGPTVTITSPADGSMVPGPVVLVQGTVSDNRTGVEWVTVNGLKAQLDGSDFSIILTNQFGTITYEVIARDGVGNLGTASVTVDVIYDATPPAVEITAPSHNAYITSRTVTVTGKVTDNAPLTFISVSVNGVAAEFQAENGIFTLNIPTIADGTITLVAIASDFMGNRGYSAPVTINVDTTHPRIVDSEPQHFGALRVMYNCNYSQTPQTPPGEPCPIPQTPTWDDMPPNQSLLLSFSEPINSNDLLNMSLDTPDDPIILQSSLTTQLGCTVETVIPSSISISADGQHLYIDPQNDLAVGTYKLIVKSQDIQPPGNRISDLAGNLLSNWFYMPSGGCYRFLFTVSGVADQDPPAISSVEPEASETKVSTNTDILAVFDESLDPLSVDSSTFLLINQSTIQNVPGMISVEEESKYKKFHFTPSLPLEYNTQYMIKITGLARDMAGNNMGPPDFTSVFTTAADDISSDTEPPIISLVTLNQIDSLFNCSNDPGVEDDAIADADSYLVVPRTGFSINIKFEDAGVGIDPSINGTLEVKVGETLNNTIPPNTDIGDAFTVTANKARLTIGSDLTFPVAGATISVKVKDKNGNWSGISNYYFQVVEATPDIMPFENTQYVYLDFSRDFFSINLNEYQPGSWEINYIYGPNNLPDFQEELVIFGLNTSGNAPIVPNSGGLNTNQVVRNMIKKRIKQRLDRHFGIYTNDEGEEIYRDENSVNIAFVLSPPAGLLRPPSPDKKKSECPNPDEFCDAPPLYNDNFYTDICFGGKRYGKNTTIRQYIDLRDDNGFKTGGDSTGVSHGDPQNDHQNSLCGRIGWDGDYAPGEPPIPHLCSTFTTQLMGVFMGVVNYIYYNFQGGSPFPTNLFRVVFDPFNRMYSLPECNFSGTTPAQCSPIGELVLMDGMPYYLDPIILDPTFDRTSVTGNSPQGRRYDQIMRAVEAYSYALATLAAHELGHSLGVTMGVRPDLSIYCRSTPPYPPYSAFGGYCEAFPGRDYRCTDAGIGNHIELSGFEPYGYFLGDAEPIMSHSIATLPRAISEGTAFTSYEKAYLLNKTFYLSECPRTGCENQVDCNYPNTPSCLLNCCIDQCPAP